MSDPVLDIQSLDLEARGVARSDPEDEAAKRIGAPGALRFATALGPCDVP